MISIYKHPRALLYVTFKRDDLLKKDIPRDEFNRLADELQKQINDAPHGVPSGNTGFDEGARWRGFHVSPDGLMSSNVEYLLPNDMYTNSLAPHYLRHYRSRFDSLEWFRLGLWISQTTKFDLPPVIIEHLGQKYTFHDFMSAMLADPVTKSNLCKEGYMDWCSNSNIWLV